MPDEFPYDVFLSHSAKDKALVRPLAERLRADGIFNSSQPSTFNSQLPPGPFRFRDPLNKERHFLPLRLDDAPKKGSGWFRKDDDVRWQVGVPPKGNANFAWVQHFIHYLAPQGMAGFVLANPTRIAHCCPMKIVEDVCKYAAEQGVAEAEALAKGMAEKSKEFVQGGAELYQPEQAVVEQLQGIQHGDLEINHRQIY